MICVEPTENTELQLIREFKIEAFQLERLVTVKINLKEVETTRSILNIILVDLTPSIVEDNFWVKEFLEKFLSAQT